MNQPASPPFDRRSGDSLVQVIAHKLESLHGDVGDMRAILRELTAAVTKLAVIEERQGQTSLALERAFKEIEKCSARSELQHASGVAELKLLQARVAALEIMAPAAKQTSTWVTSFVTGAAVLVLMFIAGKAGMHV